MSQYELANLINRQCGECDAGQDRAHSPRVGNCVVQVMAEYIAESAVDARIETRSGCIKCEKTESTGAGGSGQRRCNRIQPWHKLGYNKKPMPIPRKARFRPAIVGLGVSRESVNEMENFVTALPTCLIPDPVRENATSNSQNQRRNEAQLPRSYERSDRN